MIICILASNANVEAVRETAYANIPEFVGHPLLNFPVSYSGSDPVTHWFCQFKSTQDVYDRVLALQHLSEMEIADPIRFLSSRNLKIIRNHIP